LSDRVGSLIIFRSGVVDIAAAEVDELWRIWYFLTGAVDFDE
jgi:hypothetical protein